MLHILVCTYKSSKSHWNAHYWAPALGYLYPRGRLVRMSSSKGTLHIRRCHRMRWYDCRVESRSWCRCAPNCWCRCDRADTNLDTSRVRERAVLCHVPHHHRSPVIVGWANVRRGHVPGHSCRWFVLRKIDVEQLIAIICVCVRWAYHNLLVCLN